jgi:hypothetical protein
MSVRCVLHLSQMSVQALRQSSYKIYRVFYSCGILISHVRVARTAGYEPEEQNVHCVDQEVRGYEPLIEQKY